MLNITVFGDEANLNYILYCVCVRMQGFIDS